MNSFIGSSRLLCFSIRSITNNKEQDAGETQSKEGDDTNADRVFWHVPLADHDGGSADLDHRGGTRSVIEWEVVVDEDRGGQLGGFIVVAVIVDIKLNEVEASTGGNGIRRLEVVIHLLIGRDDETDAQSGGGAGESQAL